MEHNKSKTDFGQTLINLMKAHKISIEKVGKCLNLPKPDVIALMYAETPPALHPTDRKNLCALLKCEQDTLFKPLHTNFFHRTSLIL